VLRLAEADFEITIVESDDTAYTFRVKQQMPSNKDVQKDMSARIIKIIVSLLSVPRRCEILQFGTSEPKWGEFVNLKLSRIEEKGDICTLLRIPNQQ
jgi:hypothetical protein